MIDENLVKSNASFNTPGNVHSKDHRIPLTESIYKRKLETNIDHIDNLEEQINIYKKLVCCYELNRQTLVKLIGYLVTTYPHITNDINKDVTENTVLLENIIEHYLAHVKFKVVEELDNFIISANDLTFLSSKNTIENKINQNNESFLKHPLSSSLCQPQEYDNQNPYNENMLLPQENWKESFTEFNHDFKINKHIENSSKDQQNVKNKYPDTKIHDMTKELNKNKDIVRERILQIENRLKMNKYAKESSQNYD